MFLRDKRQCVRWLRHHILTEENVAPPRTSHAGNLPINIVISPVTMRFSAAAVTAVTAIGTCLLCTDVYGKNESCWNDLC